MSDTKAFDAIHEKEGRGEELTPIEKALFILWENNNGHEWASFAAAAELAAMISAIEAARELEIEIKPDGRVFVMWDAEKFRDLATALEAVK